MKEHCEDFRRVGCEPLAVSFSPPEAASAFLTDFPLPFQLVCDPARASYETFGLERTSWAGILRAGVIARYLRLMFRGWGPRKPRRHEDVLQLGGDFILDAERRVIYAHRSAEPTDRPKIEELLAAARRAAAVSTP